MGVGGGKHSERRWEFTIAAWLQLGESVCAEVGGERSDNRKPNGKRSLDGGWKEEEETGINTR